MCAILSRCVCIKGLSLKRYNIVTTADHLKIVCHSSGGYFHQSCHAIKASTDINVDKLAEFFVEKGSAHVLPLPQSNVRHKGLQHPNFPEVSIEELRRPSRAFASQEFRSRPAINVHPTRTCRRHTNGPWHLMFKTALMALTASVVNVQPILPWRVRISKGR